MAKPFKKTVLVIGFIGGMMEEVANALSGRSERWLKLKEANPDVWPPENHDEGEEDYEQLDNRQLSDTAGPQPLVIKEEKGGIKI